MSMKQKRKVPYHGAEEVNTAVRKFISETAEGDLIPMSATIMMQKLVDQGMMEEMAAKLPSQIRKGAPLYNEWKAAYNEKKFEQKLGRAPNSTTTTTMQTNKRKQSTGQSTITPTTIKIDTQNIYKGEQEFLEYMTHIQQVQRDDTEKKNRRSHSATMSSPQPLPPPRSNLPSDWSSSPSLRITSRTDSNQGHRHLQRHNNYNRTLGGGPGPEICDTILPPPPIIPIGDRNYHDYFNHQQNRSSCSLETELQHPPLPFGPPPPFHEAYYFTADGYPVYRADHAYLHHHHPGNLVNVNDPTMPRPPAPAPMMTMRANDRDSHKRRRRETELTEEVTQRNLPQQPLVQNIAFRRSVLRQPITEEANLAWPTYDQEQHYHHTNMTRSMSSSSDKPPSPLSSSQHHRVCWNQNNDFNDLAQMQHRLHKREQGNTSEARDLSTSSSPFGSSTQLDPLNRLPLGLILNQGVSVIPSSTNNEDGIHRQQLDDSRNSDVTASTTSMPSSDSDIKPSEEAVLALLALAPVVPGLS